MENIQFPKDGISLAVLDEFIEACGGKAVLEKLTTADVCEKFVKPLTFFSKCSFCELLKTRDMENEKKKNNNNSNKKEPLRVKEATVFISHAWQFLFMDVVDALKFHFEGKEEGVYMWFDLFSNDQHNTTEFDFLWWSTTFKSAIAKFGRTVLILSPWDNPIPLRR